MASETSNRPSNNRKVKEPSPPRKEGLFVSSMNTDDKPNSNIRKIVSNEPSPTRQEGGLFVSSMNTDDKPNSNIRKIVSNHSTEKKPAVRKKPGQPRLDIPKEILQTYAETPPEPKQSLSLSANSKSNGEKSPGRSTLWTSPSQDNLSGSRKGPSAGNILAASRYRVPDGDQDVGVPPPTVPSVKTPAKRSKPANANNTTIASKYLISLKDKAGSYSSINLLRLIGGESPATSPSNTSSPIAGYNEKDPVSLKEAVIPLLNIIPNLMDHVELAFSFVKQTVKDAEILKNPSAFAAVNLYTQEWDPASDSLYWRLNALLRDDALSPQVKYDQLKPYHPYLNLLLSRLQSLPKFKGTVYRGIKLDLRKSLKPDSVHTWWNITSCTDTVSGIAEFLDIQGSRTFLDIFTHRGVKISEHSQYPLESEILLLPGTCLKVVDQLDLGNGLVAIQMHEIPSDIEIAEALFHEREAIEFWKALAVERFEIPLEEFCEAVIKQMKLPVVKSWSNNGKIRSSIERESYQKYWSLWIFSGGDEQTFSAYTTETLDPPRRRECFISYQRFGLLLAWFGHFRNGEFLSELYNATQLKIFYDDNLSSQSSANFLRRYVNNNSYQWNSDLWLIRCSPKRDYPFSISYIKPEAKSLADTEKPSAPPVNHQRIMLNPSTRLYTFQNIETKTVSTHESITGLVDIIKRQYKFGKGVSNVTFDPLYQIDGEKAEDCYTGAF